MLLFFTFIIAFTLIINVMMEFRIDMIEPVVAKPEIPATTGTIGMPAIPAVGKGDLQ